jgi:hypothetical protein
VDSLYEPVVCILCGARNGTAADLEVAEATHSPDLDLRPAGRARRQLAAWVQRCDGCGYCHSALDALPEGLTRDAAQAVVSGAPYATALDDQRYPPLANLFRAMALLQRATAQPDSADLAALSLLYAAWACDDAADAPPEGMPAAQAAAQARSLRRGAAEVLRSALEAGRAPAVDAPTSWLVLADCYRRAEAFPSAHTATVRGLAAAASAAEENAAHGVLQELLAFEQQLVEAQETGAVNMAQAFEEGP